MKFEKKNTFAPNNRSIKADSISFEDKLEIKVNDYVVFKNNIDIKSNSQHEGKITIRAINNNYPVYVFFQKDIYSTLTVSPSGNYVDNIGENEVRLDLSGEISIGPL